MIPLSLCILCLAEAPATAPATAPASRPQTWSDVRMDLVRARRWRSGVVSVIKKDSIVISVPRRREEPLAHTLKTDAHTKILIPVPAKPDPGDKIVGRATVVRYVDGERKHLTPGQPVSYGFDEDDFAIVIEVKPNRAGGAIVVTGYPPVDPAARVTTTSTRPTTRAVKEE